MLAGVHAALIAAAWLDPRVRVGVKREAGAESPGRPELLTINPVQATI